METFQKECKHGKFVLLRNDFISDCLSLYGEWAESEAQLFLDILSPGDCVIEVGANIGAHSIPISRTIGKQGRLLCIEPQRIISQILSASFVINNLSNARVICAVAAEKNGSVALVESDYSQWSNNGFFKVPDRLAKASGENTATVTVDQLVKFYGLTDLKLLKIDVEGMEENVLKGSHEVIQKLRPFIFFECGTWENPQLHQRGDAINSWIRGNNYELYWFCGLGFNPQNFNKIAENKIGTFGDINILAVPVEKSVARSLKKVESVSQIYRKEIEWV